MTRRTILTREFLAGLPVHDPEESFLMVVERAEEFLDDSLQSVDDNERGSWRAYEEDQHKAVSTIIAAARRFEIEPFAKMDVPMLRDFQSDNFKDFKSDLDHYVTQTLLDHAIRTRRDAIQMAPKLKDKLRSYVASIKTVIDQADISESKRAKLHAKIQEFEEALEKDRVPIFAMVRVVVEVVSIGANALQFADSQTFHKLVANVLEVVGEAKAEDDNNRPMPPHELPRAALPPRQIIYQPKGGFAGRGPKEAFPRDLDDEIPF